MYRSNRSFNIPPGQPPGHLTCSKIIVQTPPYPSQNAVQMPQCTHPEDISQGHKWQKDGDGEGLIHGGAYFRNFYGTSGDCPLFKKFGKCCAIHHWKLPKIQTGLFGWMENANCFWIELLISCFLIILFLRGCCIVGVIFTNTATSQHQFKIKRRQVIQL